jgi:Arc/MetJ-type ribon-helix-helix transcriptional regulator
MATQVTLDDEVQARIDAMISAGRFDSREEAVRTGVLMLDADFLDPSLSAGDVAAIREGLADEAAGRVYDAKEVFDELRGRFGTH